jgi:hypothetical protein
MVVQMNQKVTSDPSGSSAVAELTSKTLAKYNWLQWFLYFLAVSLIIITGYLCILTPYGQVGSYILAIIYTCCAISISFLTYDLVNVGYDLTHIDQDLKNSTKNEAKNLNKEKTLNNQFKAENEELKKQVNDLTKKEKELKQSIEDLNKQFVTEQENNERMALLQEKTTDNNRAICQQNANLLETTKKEQAEVNKLAEICETLKL